MAVERILSTAPRVKIEIPNISIIGDVIARVWIADPVNNIFPVQPTGFLEFFGSSGSPNEHLMRMLQEAGVPGVTYELAAVEWLNSTPKDQAMATLRVVWNRFLTELCELINRFYNQSSAPPTTGPTFASVDDLFQTMLNNASFSVVNGKITATF